MVSWKVGAVAGAAGAVISLAAGFAAGNAFGTVLLRALVSALLAGGLGFAVQRVLRRFLPDLGARAPAEPSGAVDILIDEEVPLAPQQPQEQALQEEPGPAAAEESGPGGAETGSPSELKPGEGPAAGPAGGLAELEAGLEPLAGYPFSTDPGGPEEELPPAPEEPGVLEGLGGTGLPAEEAGGLEGLTGLDSIGSSTPSSRSLKAEELEARLSSLTKGQPPESLAKAVRTFMRKD